MPANEPAGPFGAAFGVPPRQGSPHRSFSPYRQAPRRTRIRARATGHPRRRLGMSLREVRATLVALAVLVFGPPTRSSAAQAQNGTVRGRVTEAGSQRPVNDVQVTVVGTAFGALTSQNGEYTISNVPAGQRTIRLRRLGFNLADRPVTV